MRLFISLDVQNEEYFKSLQQQLPKQAHLTFPDSFHITLKFLGDVPLEAVSKIKSVLDKVEMKDVQFSTGQIGAFPDKKNPKVVWVSVQPTYQIEQLQKSIDEALSPLFPKEQSFVPHITLARVKAIRDPVFIEKLDQVKPAQKVFTLSWFQLTESTLTPKGSIYRSLFSKHANSE